MATTTRIETAEAAKAEMLAWANGEKLAKKYGITIERAVA